MGRHDNFRQYAADCVRRAEIESNPGDKNLLLNMALAWIRLAQQSQAAMTPPTDEARLPSPATVPSPGAAAAPPA